MIKGSSAELQELALQGLLSDPYMLAKCIKVVNESYFENLGYKLIFKALSVYYKQYCSMPNKQQMIVTLQSVHDETYGKLEEVLSVFEKLYDGIDLSNVDFLYEQVADFIRRHRIEDVLDEVYKYLNNDGNVDLSKVAVRLKDSLDINFNKVSAYTLSDISKVKEVKEEALGPSDNPVIIKFFIDAINTCLQYRGMIPGTVNMIVAPPGRGKTTLAINQGLSVAKQGYNVLHVFLGDMSRYDGLLRYLSCISGVDTSKLVPLENDQLQGVIRKWNMTGVLSYISVMSYAADEKTPDQLIEEIKDQQREHRIHYDCIIIDYDENFAKEADNMYESGGNVYNRISLFAVTNKSVIFILAQPKPAYWDKEIIPLEAAAESSKKQKIIDLMLTIGSPSKTSSIGMLTIAKNRRGEDGKRICIRKNGSNARIEAITQEEYENIKKSEKTNVSNIENEE